MYLHNGILQRARMNELQFTHCIDDSHIFNTEQKSQHVSLKTDNKVDLWYQNQCSVTLDGAHRKGARGALRGL